MTLHVASNHRVPSGIVRVELDEPETALTPWPSRDSAGKDNGSRVPGEQYDRRPCLSSTYCLTHPCFVGIA